MKLSRSSLLLFTALALTGCNENVTWSDSSDSGSNGFSCNAPNVVCDGQCINPRVSDDYCGADSSCGSFDKCVGDKHCVRGVCVSKPEKCPTAGEVKCGNICIDPKTSNDFCGADDACDYFDKCESFETCRNGVCVQDISDTCSVAGQIKCNGICINPKTSNDYCGADDSCGNFDKCETDETCNNGVCEPNGNTCDVAGQVKCNGTCIDPKTSNDFCGADASCGNFDKCETNETCNNGVCEPNDDCPVSGQVKCDGTCIDPKTSNEYCGADDSCGNFDKCDAGEGCSNGVCESLPCDTEGQVRCGATCINPKTSNNYCGADAACGNFDKCETNETCTDGVCKPNTIECNANQHVYGDGCEDDSLQNCGEHEKSCLSIDGWEEGTCTDAKCVVTKCISGKHPSKDKNACFRDDVANCGADEYSCKDAIHGWGNGECTDGQCVLIQCSRLDSTHMSASGDSCDDDNLDNCGAVGRACSDVISGWSDGTCYRNECTVSACVDGTHLVERTNSCDPDDIDNCGAAGKKCADEISGWAEGTCTDAACVLTKCVDGKHLSTTPNTCDDDTNNDCGDAHDDCTALGEGYYCSNGQCKKNCDGGLTLCDGESVCIDLTSNANNCGSCGNVCSTEGIAHAASMACESSSCVVDSCVAGYSVIENDGNKSCGCAEGYDEEGSKCCLVFADAEFKAYALTAAENAGTSLEYKWDHDGDGCITKEEAESDKVESLKLEAFYKNTVIKSAQDVNSFIHLWKFNNKAFMQSSLEGKVELKYVESLGLSAFYKAEGITEVDMPELTNTDSGVFYGCTGLTKVNLPKLKKIGPSTFRGTTNLTEIELPSANDFGNYVFRDSGVTKLSITAEGAITLTASTWSNFTTENVDLVLNSDKKTGGSGAPLVESETSWGGATWKSITFTD